jgi:hypothetical protein
MKKILFISLIIISGSNNLLLSWDSTAAKFYPLAVGNKWSYTKKIYSPPMNCFSPMSQYVFVLSITGDTVISGHKYFRFSDGNLVRIDSNSMNVYKRIGEMECITDSLLARKNDMVQTCQFFIMVTDTNEVFFAGENRRTKAVSIPGYRRQIMFGIGLYFDGGCELNSGVTDVLNGCIINGIQYGEMMTFSISGIVRYQDNNQPVTSGKVKALKLDRQTRQIVTLDSAIIQPDGSYVLPGVPTDSTDIMAFQDDEETADFVPTYYPSTINWQNSNTLYPTTNLTDINIGVYRNNMMSGNKQVSGYIYSSTFLDAIAPLKDAYIYIRTAGSYRAYSRSLSSGYYSMDNLEDGTYHLYVERLGYNSASQVIKINNSSQDNISFTLSFYFTGVMLQNNHIPSSYSLFQNYPNPFNPVTNIRFSIPNSGFVKLAVFDMLGREAETLVNGSLNPGTYNADWDASGYSSGVYFYRLDAEDYSEVKKMVLVK